MFVIVILSNQTLTAALMLVQLNTVYDSQK